MVYNFIESLDKKTLFNYIVICLIIYLYFRDVSIGLNIIIVIFSCYIAITFLHEKQTNLLELESEQMKKKLDSIRPKLETSYSFEDKKDIVDFIYSVQDLYVYNPETYEEFIDNLNTFFIIYDIDFYIFDYYTIALSKKENATNCFHSLIYKLPNVKVLTDKFNRAHKRLETLLTKYMNDIYSKCQKHIIINGYNINTKIPNKGPMEYNNYVNNHFQIY